MKAIDQSSTRLHTFFKGHRSVCTLFSGLFISVHIFFLPVIQIVSRVHTFSVFSCPAAPKFRIRVPRSGSWRACRKGGVIDSFPVNARSAGPRPGSHQLCNIFCLSTLPASVSGGWRGWGADKLLLRTGVRKGQGGGGEWEGGATHGRKGVRGGRPDGLAAQRENTVGEQCWGSCLVRDAEGVGSGAAFN